MFCFTITFQVLFIEHVTKSPSSIFHTLIFVIHPRARMKRSIFKNYKFKQKTQKPCFDFRTSVSDWIGKFVNCEQQSCWQFLSKVISDQ